MIIMACTSSKSNKFKTKSCNFSTFFRSGKTHLNTQIHKYKVNISLENICVFLYKNKTMRYAKKMFCYWKCLIVCGVMLFCYLIWRVKQQSLVRNERSVNL